mmetsp:Transcript_53366/g.130389  ORF Transcript_53366/g.130389 Transcript_53366/m.130389 type:complete len:219 (+) Transcript_53366:779-1435(+)
MPIECSVRSPRATDCITSTVMLSGAPIDQSRLFSPPTSPCAWMKTETSRLTGAASTLDGTGGIRPPFTAPDPCRGSISASASSIPFMRLRFLGASSAFLLLLLLFELRFGESLRARLGFCEERCLGGVRTVPRVSFGTTAASVGSHSGLPTWCQNQLVGISIPHCTPPATSCPPSSSGSIGQLNVLVHSPRLNALLLVSRSFRLARTRSRVLWRSLSA